MLLMLIKKKMISLSSNNDLQKKFTKWYYVVTGGT